jgi:hypothetical protein
MRLWIIGFLLTNAIELPIYAWFLRGRVSARAIVPLVLALNIATHPAAWLLHPHLGIVFVEIAVIVVETVLLTIFLRDPRRALLAAFAANAASTAAGLIFF